MEDPIIFGLYSDQVVWCHEFVSVVELLQETGLGYFHCDSGELAKGLGYAGRQMLRVQGWSVDRLEGAGLSKSSFNLFASQNDITVVLIGGNCRVPLFNAALQQATVFW